MYLFNSLDRSNLGSAETVNMTGDLGIPADSINQATTLFYATCMLELSLVLDCSDLFSRYVYPLSVYIGKRIGSCSRFPFFLFQAVSRGVRHD